MTTNNRQNFGLLGGTFDPPHAGHLNISKIIIKKLNLHKLFWSITKKNPLKKNYPLFDENKRIALCKKIIKNEKKIILLKTNKIKNADMTINIIKHLKKKIKKNQHLFFIIGADNLINFHKWKNYSKIFSLCTLIIMNRSGYQKKALQSVSAKKYSKYRKNLSILGKEKPNRNEWAFVYNKPINISSSKLRISLYK